MQNQVTTSGRSVTTLVVKVGEGFKFGRSLETGGAGLSQSLFRRGVQC